MMISTVPRLTKYLLVMGALMIVPRVVASAEAWHPLDLTITGIESKRGGQINIFVFQEDGFPITHSKAVRSYVKPVVGSKVTISLEVPADISFALKVHHDEDGNNKVTKNWTGIFPAEGLGFSSGARMNVAPPLFVEAEMTLPSDDSVSIEIRYP